MQMENIWQTKNKAVTWYANLNGIDIIDFGNVNILVSLLHTKLGLVNFFVKEPSKDENAIKYLNFFSRNSVVNVEE